jgi:hypothetical protein
MCGKGDRQHEADTANAAWWVRATLLRKKLQGGVHSLDKGLFMGTDRKAVCACLAKKSIVQEVRTPAHSF